jgi:murein DD-endopeptidase MepM/ murein hydrolase activator NlpD
MTIVRVLALMLTLLLAGISALRAQDRGACDESATLSEFIACLKGQTATHGEKPAEVCTTRPVAMPVEGRHLLGFGDRTEHGARSKGIVIETAPGAPVFAPASGIVLFCGGWRDYGQLVIVSAGCGVDVLMAGGMSVNVSSNSHVERGAFIGKMSEYASPNLPVLYFELREHGTPVNPEP